MKKPADSRDAMAAAGAVSALAALAHASRLGAFRQLVQAGPGGLAVGELRTRLGLPGATLSAHLNVLRGAGLVVDEREGRVIRLRADYARMNGLLDYLTENCCAGDACTPAGVPLDWPLSRRRRWLLPAAARIPTGSLREYTLTVLLTAALLMAFVALSG